MKLIIYFIQFIFISILFIIFKLIGYNNASNLGSFIGKNFGRFIRSEKIILKNIDQITSNSNFDLENKNKLVKDMFSNYGRILSEYMYLRKFRNGKLKKFVSIKGENYLDEIQKKNKRVIFVSGHFNNFELMAMFIDSKGIKLSAIYRPLNNIFLNKIMEYLRIKYVCKNQIRKGKSGTRNLLRNLKNNFSVALMIDQRVSEGIKSELFGKPAYTTTIPAQIIKKFDCEIVPVFIERYQKVKFNLIFEEPIKFDKKHSVEEITYKLNKILEKMILKDPAQWILTHNRWK